MIYKADHFWAYTCAAINAGDWPFHVWVRLVPIDMVADHSVGCFTQGLTDFVGREIELLPVLLQASEAVRRVRDIASYLLSSGPVLKDGDTLGYSVAERIRIRHLDRENGYHHQFTNWTSRCKILEWAREMTYFLTSFSFAPINDPQFYPVYEDSSEFKYKRIHILDLGQPISENTSPSIQDLYQNAQLAGKSKKLPDIFHTGSEICLNQVMRNTIEDLEPSTHQFFPIMLRQKNREPFPGNYWLLNICNLLDAVIFDKSNLRLVRTTSG